MSEKYDIRIKQLIRTIIVIGVVCLGQLFQSVWKTAVHDNEIKHLREDVNKCITIPEMEAANKDLQIELMEKWDEKFENAAKDIVEIINKNSK